MGKKGKILLLAAMWTASFTLFGLSAQASKHRRPEAPMTADETAYRTVRPVGTTELGNEKKAGPVTVEGCLSESELAALLNEKLSFVLDNISVSVGNGEFTLYGDLTSDTDALLDSYEALTPYELILRLLGGAPVSATLRMNWTGETGFQASAGDVTLGGVPIPVGDLTKLCDGFAASMDLRFSKAPYRVERWELLSGGLYYRALLPEKEQIVRLYPAPL